MQSGAFELERIQGFQVTGSEVLPWRQERRHGGRQDPWKQRMEELRVWEVGVLIFK